MEPVDRKQPGSGAAARPSLFLWTGMTVPGTNSVLGVCA
jgi:hypothetical protein